MEIFKNKFLIKLIAALCLFLTLLNFAGTAKVYATNSSKEKKVWGSVLIVPITNLLTGIGDSIMEILHDSIQSQKQAIIKIDGSDSSKNAWARFGAIVVGLLAGVAFIALAVAGGVGIAILTAKILASTAAAVGATVSVRSCRGRSCCWSNGW